MLILFHQVLHITYLNTKDMNHKLICLIILFNIYIDSLSLHAQKPNVIIVYADDLGYGDLSCYGATKIKTPNIDLLADKGIRFTRAYSTSATCTPSRYSLMTGKYAFRKSGTGVLPGDAALIIDTHGATLPKVFKQASYRTAIVGKWHLGLGTSLQKNWNEKISPGPNEIGFDYSYIFPATADRVPTVFIENGEVASLDKSDTIRVNYQERIGNEPTGRENPELLKLKNSLNHGHDQTIINGIGRIGYMTGGKAARWTDEEVSTTFLAKAMEFVEQNKNNPFFLFFSLTEPHVPRMPATMFKGKSGLGLRGDAILQIDWTIKLLMEKLEYLGIEKNTIVIFTSDNGPVLDDGYDDGAVSQLHGHTPAGILRGGKYSIYEAGTRVPFIVYWPKKIRSSQVSSALISQVDFISSFKQPLGIHSPDEKTDSENHWPALIGKSKVGREKLILHAGTLALLHHDWKYIEPSDGQMMSVLTNIELGNRPYPQLFDLSTDPGEKINLASQQVDKMKSMEEELVKIKSAHR